MGYKNKRIITLLTLKDTVDLSKSILKLESGAHTDVWTLKDDAATVSPIQEEWPFREIPPKDAFCISKGAKVHSHPSVQKCNFNVRDFLLEKHP